jgi:hypothetical protein
MRTQYSNAMERRRMGDVRGEGEGEGDVLELQNVERPVTARIPVDRRGEVQPNSAACLLELGRIQNGPQKPPASAMLVVRSGGR